MPAMICTALPKAYLGQAKAFLPDKVVRICANCPDRVAAEALADAEGADTTHGMCDDCFHAELQRIKKYFSK